MSERDQNMSQDLDRIQKGIVCAVCDSLDELIDMWCSTHTGGIRQEQGLCLAGSW